MAITSTALTPSPASLEASSLVVTLGDRRVLDGASLSLRAGELTAIVGPSGGGKSTLLRALAGTAAPDEGVVQLHGAARVGLVPQEDIIHLDLPLRRTLVHAARLRLGRPEAQVTGAVDEILAELDLTERGSVAVGHLSGGQRKRASIAVELLAQPAVLLLDEPTAGLDPATAASLMRMLRRLADGGCAVVLTTHQVSDLDHVDAIALLDEGRVRLLDDPAEALAALLPAVDVVDAPIPHHAPASPVRSRAGLRQLRALSRRNVEVLVRGRLTLAILLGSPLLVVGMFAVLFQPGAFAGGADPAGHTMVAYWLAFAGFFFGLTYGLLQICTERPIASRERFAGVGSGAYLASKAAVLVPLLFVVDLTLVVVLQALDRLPALGAGPTATLVAVLLLDSVAALTLGLLLSALVADAAQAALALPMVCFPAVLFAGAIVPVPAMAAAGRAISVVTPARWAFESVAAGLDVAVPGGSTSTLPGVAALVVCTVVLLGGLLVALPRRL